MSCACCCTLCRSELKIFLTATYVPFHAATVTSPHDPVPMVRMCVSSRAGIFGACSPNVSMRSIAGGVGREGVRGRLKDGDSRASRFLVVNNRKG